MALTASPMTDHGNKLGRCLEPRVGPLILAALAAQLHPKLSLTSDNHRSVARRGEVKLSASQLRFAQGRYNKTNKECTQLRWKEIPCKRT